MEVLIVMRGNGDTKLEPAGSERGVRFSLADMELKGVSNL